MIRNTLSGSANRCHQICGDHQPTPLSAALSRQNESGCRHLSAPRAPIWGSSLPPKSGTSAAACLLLSNPPPKSRHGGKGTDWAAAADGWGVVGGDMGQGLGDPLPLLSTFWHGKPGDSPRDGTLKLQNHKTGCNLQTRESHPKWIADRPPSMASFWRDFPHNVRPSDQRDAVENGGGWTGRTKGTCRVLMFWLVPWERRRRRPPFMRSLAEGHPRLGPLGE